MFDRAAPLPPGVEDCPHCGGRGWRVEDDGGAGTARACDCRRQGLGARLLSASGIPPRYGRCRLETFDTDNPDSGIEHQLQRALATTKRYVEEFLDPEDGQFTDTGLVYVGPTGAGKTHLAAAVLAELIRRYRVRGRFIEFTALIHQIQASFDPASGTTKAEILEPVVAAELLVLDELGAQKPTAWVLDVLYLIINTRYTRRLPTLFTTNYRLTAPASALRPAGGSDGEVAGAGRGAEPLAHRLGANLVSRLHEMARPVAMEAVEDYRREVWSRAFRG